MGQWVALGNGVCFHQVFSLILNNSSSWALLLGWEVTGRWMGCSLVHSGYFEQEITQQH